MHEISELGLGQDLNGDGDTFDTYPEIFRIGTGSLQRIPLPIADLYTGEKMGKGFLFDVPELLSGDLNGDGDQQDTMLFVHRLTPNLTTNTGVSELGGHRVRPRRFSFFASENNDGVDHTGDGDMNDRALFVGRFQ